MNLTETRAWGAARGAFWANPPRGDCACGERNAIMYEREEPGEPPCCANCYRQSSVRDREQACDDCGRGPAFRDPGHREDHYRCLECHAKVGYTLEDAGMLRKLMGRAGPTHSQGRVDPCVAAGSITECRGQVKPRQGVPMCDFHHDPVKYLKNRQA